MVNCWTGNVSLIHPGNTVWWLAEIGSGNISLHPVFFSSLLWTDFYPYTFVSETIRLCGGLVFYCCVLIVSLNEILWLTIRVIISTCVCVLWYQIMICQTYGVNFKSFMAPQLKMTSVFVAEHFSVDFTRNSHVFWLIFCLLSFHRNWLSFSIYQPYFSFLMRYFKTYNLE